MSEIDPLNAENYPAITPMLTVSDVSAAVEFYTKAFGFSLRGLMKDKEGNPIHAELVLRGSVLMLTPELKNAEVEVKTLAAGHTKMPETKLRGGYTAKSLGGSSATVHLSVPNVDEVAERAISMGAKAWGGLETMFWGDRRQHVIDQDGHDWEIVTHVANVGHKEFAKDNVVLEIGQKF